MSDKDTGKKEAELMELEPFLSARRFVTGESLFVVEVRESPDFVCERRNGSVVGVELTKVTRDPRDIFWERILYRKEEIAPYEAQESIFYLIEKKELARASRYVARVPETILVLQLVDGTIDTVSVALEGIREDFKNHGFHEIWLADYSGLEAYGDIELFGLFPEKWWGYHERPEPDRKPFG